MIALIRGDKRVAYPFESEDFLVLQDPADGVE